MHFETRERLRQIDLNTKSASTYCSSLLLFFILFFFFTFDFFFYFDNLFTLNVRGSRDSAKIPSSVRTLFDVTFSFVVFQFVKLVL